MVQEGKHFAVLTAQQTDGRVQKRPAHVEQNAGRSLCQVEDVEFPENSHPQKRSAAADRSLNSQGHPLLRAKSAFFLLRSAAAKADALRLRLLSVSAKRVDREGTYRDEGALRCFHVARTVSSAAEGAALENSGLAAASSRASPTASPLVERIWRERR